MTYILDVLIREAQFSNYLRNITSPMWFVVQATGLSKSVMTQKVIPQAVIVFNFASRLILNLQTLQDTYLTISLCTVSARDPTKPQLIASARVRLANLPLGQMVKLNFPLFDSMDSRKEAVILDVQACLSDFNAVTQQRHSYNPMNNGPSPPNPFIQHGQQQLPNHRSQSNVNHLPYTF